MPFQLRPRRLATRGAGAAALTVALVALTACGDYPNSVFHSRTEFNRDIDSLFQLIINLGVVVFVLVFALLIGPALWTRRGVRVPAAIAAGLLACAAGLALSWALDWPSGACVALALSILGVLSVTALGDAARATSGTARGR